MNKNISQANLPNIKLTVDSFSLGRGNMDITGEVTAVDTHFKPTGAFYNEGKGSTCSDAQYSRDLIKFQASRTWTGTTNSVSPQTSTLGSGQALDITPSYYTTHMWLRLS